MRAMIWTRGVITVAVLVSASADLLSLPNFASDSASVWKHANCL